MKEIIWVMGPSAVGKERFIKTLAGDPKTLQLLNLEDRSIVSCSASYHFNGAYKGDAIDEAREKMFDEIPDLLNKYDVVLIKWQHVDSEMQRPERLRELLPNVNHRAVLLVAPKQELIRRLPSKSWWHEHGDEQNHVNAGVRHVIESMNSLPESLIVTKILSSEDKPYSVINDSNPTEFLY